MIDVSALGEILELRLLDLDLEGDLDLLIIPRTGAPKLALNLGRVLGEPGDPPLPWPDGEASESLEIAFARDRDNHVSEFCLRKGMQVHGRLVEQQDGSTRSEVH